MQVKYKPLCYVSDQRPWICHILFHRHFKYLLCSFTVILGLILYSAGVITLLYEIDFTEYTYPLEIDNIRSIIEHIDDHHKGQGRELIVNYSSIVSTITGYTDVRPFNQFEDLDILIDIKNSCSQPWHAQQSKSSELNSSTRNQHLKQQFNRFSFSRLASPNSPSTESLYEGKSIGGSNVCNTSRVQETEKLDPIKILVTVKSAVNNYHRRQAIRNSWYVNGRYNDEFSIKTVFVVGACHQRNYVPSDLSESAWSAEDCHYHIGKESSIFGDIIQGSFVDMYYNNTLKTFTTMRWINDNCRQADFILALDDDYFLEIENLLNYIKNATITTSLNLNSTSTQPPHDIAKLDMTRDGYLHKGVNITTTKCNTNNIVIDNIRLMRHASGRHLWAGFVRFYVEPLRHITSKWYLPYKDYPYNKFPPFVSGGATLMSKRTMADFYYTSYFTKKFIFDDVYIGLIAYKLNIEAIHNDKFMSPIEELLENPLYIKASTRIAVHDIDPEELVNLWKKRRTLMGTIDNQHARQQDSTINHDINKTSSVAIDALGNVSTSDTKIITIIRK